jgi:hypothetical protein
MERASIYLFRHRASEGVVKPPRQPRDEVFMLGAVLMLVVVVLVATGVWGSWMGIAALVAGR